MASERIQRQIDRLLDEAEKALNRGEWALVQDRAGKAAALDPNNADAKTYLAAADRAIESNSQPSASPAAEAAVVERSHPTSSANGRYQVKKFLGEGGKKRGIGA